ncbi:tetratricopeptide repeat protein [Konateibacter massiliensis]|uniref:hypothetical protein n=1 Tax=Konateibacter massiliensis TaxID=2002841 RepID=UPI000C1556D3|nr:hypothetical protein [Konateibacter massiliensis]
MGRIILCHEKKAEKPYFIASMNLNLYTLEELCYFLYDNIYWMDEAIINDELIEWIETQLQLKELGEELRNNLGNINSFVMAVLRYVGYITEEDEEETGKRLSQYEHQSDLEKMMERASHFLESKLFMEAILEYKKLEAREDNPHMEKVYNNMGVAYANLFLYKEAANYFKRAYEQKPDEESYKNLSYAAAMMNEEERKDFQALLQGNYREVFLADMESAATSEENDKLVKLNTVIRYKNENHVAEYYKGLEHLLNEWKKEYRNYTG